MTGIIVNVLNLSNYLSECPVISATNSYNALRWTFTKIINWTVVMANLTFVNDLTEISMHWIFVRFNTLMFWEREKKNRGIGRDMCWERQLQKLVQKKMKPRIYSFKIHIFYAHVEFIYCFRIHILGMESGSCVQSLYAHITPFAVP